MSVSAAKVISPFGLCGVTTGTRINQKGFSESTALNTEQVRMAMPGAVTTSQWSEVHDQLQGIVLRSALHDRVAAVAEYLELTVRRGYRFKCKEGVGASRAL